MCKFLPRPDISYFQFSVLKPENFQEVSEQRDITEAELKDEVMARIGAEKQLQAAEKALEHLETALKLTGAQMSELQEHIMPDVHKLRGKTVISLKFKKEFQ